MALGADPKPTAKDWHEGTISAIQTKHRTLLDPHAAEIDMEIVSAGVLYQVTLAYKVHKSDLVPFAGVVTSEKRRKHTEVDAEVGDQVRFAVMKQRGILIDRHGVEQKLIVRSSAFTALR